MLEFRLLRYFVAIADEGSVTRAAAAVRVAQPSLSRQIRQLEEIVGTPLFDRGGGRLQLSAAGHAFLPVARDLVRRADVATNYLRATMVPSAVSVSLVAPETTVADVIAPFLAQRGGQTATVMVREAIPSGVFAEVLAGNADFGISSGTPPSGLASRPIIRFAVLAYVPPSDPIARHRSISIEEVAQRPIIALGAGHGTRRVFDEAIARAGLTYTLAAETNVPHVAQAMAAAGRGVAIVTDDRRYGLKPVFIETASGRLMITLFAAWNGTHYAAQAIETLVDELARYAESRYGSQSGVSADSGSSHSVRSKARSGGGSTADGD